MEEEVVGRKTVLGAAGEMSLSGYDARRESICVRLVLDWAVALRKFCETTAVVKAPVVTTLVGK